MKTIFEPFKIKSVEPIKLTTIRERETILSEAFYNPFLIKADDVIIDLLTDSGTSAMSAQQWAGIMVGDESYAGSNSFYRFESVVQNLTGMKHIIPTHQGRAAERILFSILGSKDKYIPNNTHFDTTRANVEASGAIAIDLLTPIGRRPELLGDFKGNMDIEALQTFIEAVGPQNIPLCMLTVTNNSGGGQPVSMQNIRDTKTLLSRYAIPLFLDGCRFAENAYFIKLREKGFGDKSVQEIAQEMFSYADGCTVSAKKDGLVNSGGFLALNDDSLAEKCRNLLIITEGFPTYGGLAGRDLEAMAQGLIEVVQEDYLRYRSRSVEYLGAHFLNIGIPIVRPPGGHAIYIDAKAFLPHIPPHEYPGQALAVELFRLGGIRSVEIGSVMFGKYDENGALISPAMELVRLAIPRRVYTQSHIDYVVEIAHELFSRRKLLRGLAITKESPMLRHFTARFSQLPKESESGSAKPSIKNLHM